MVAGPLMQLRLSAAQIRYARPWQQWLFAIGLLVAGVVLIVLAVKIRLGVIFIAAGAVCIRGLVQRAWRARRR